MKRWILIVAAFATVAITATVSADTGPGDQGRRLAGPFCIDKSDGTVHSIPLNQACKPDQNRKLGVAVPCKSVTINKKPVNPCLPTKGPKGDTGATGAAGAKGETGAAGSQGATGAQGAQGATGAVGATGAPGPKGDKGDKGDTGGDGYRWICKIGQGQGSLKDGGTAAEPDCVRGSDFAFKVVTLGAIVEFENGNEDDES